MMHLDLHDFYGRKRKMKNKHNNSLFSFYFKVIKKGQEERKVGQGSVVWAKSNFVGANSSSLEVIPHFLNRKSNILYV